MNTKSLPKEVKKKTISDLHWHTRAIKKLNRNSLQRRKAKGYRLKLLYRLITKMY